MCPAHSRAERRRARLWLKPLTTHPATAPAARLRQAESGNVLLACSTSGNLDWDLIVLGILYQRTNTPPGEPVSPTRARRCVGKSSFTLDHRVRANSYDPLPAVKLQYHYGGQLRGLPPRFRASGQSPSQLVLDRVNWSRAVSPTTPTRRHFIGGLKQ